MVNKQISKAGETDTCLTCAGNLTMSKRRRGDSNRMQMNMGMARR